MEYLCVTGCDKSSITLQPGETVAYRWVKRETLLAMTAQELVPQRALKLVAAGRG